MGAKQSETVAALKTWQERKTRSIGIKRQQVLAVKGAGTEQFQQLITKRLARVFHCRVGAADPLSLGVWIACCHGIDRRIRMVSAPDYLLLDATHAPSRRNPAGPL